MKLQVKANVRNLALHLTPSVPRIFEIFQSVPQAQTSSRARFKNVKKNAFCKD